MSILNPSYASWTPAGSEALVAACGRSWQMCVSHVRGEPRRADTPTACSTVKWVGCGRWRNASMASVSRPFEQRPGGVGDAAAVGEVGEVPHAEPENRPPSVPHGHRNDVLAADRERAADRAQVEEREASPFVSRLEDVGEGPPDLLQRADVAVAGNRGPLHRVEPAHVVESHDVIGVAVGEQDRVHAIEIVGEGLSTEIRGRIDEHAHPVGQFEQDRRPAPAIARVRRAAGAAAAADHRHAVGRPGAEEPDRAGAAHGRMMGDPAGACCRAATNRMRRS